MKTKKENNDKELIEEEVQRVNHGEQPQDYHCEEILQNINHEVVPQNLEPMRWVPPYVHEKLRSDSEVDDLLEMQKD